MCAPSHLIPSRRRLYRPPSHPFPLLCTRGEGSQFHVCLGPCYVGRHLFPGLQSTVAVTPLFFYVLLNEIGHDFSVASLLVRVWRIFARINRFSHQVLKKRFRPHRHRFAPTASSQCHFTLQPDNIRSQLRSSHIEKKKLWQINLQIICGYISSSCCFSTLSTQRKKLITPAT